MRRERRRIDTRKEMINVVIKNCDKKGNDENRDIKIYEKRGNKGIGGEERGRKPAEYWGRKEKEKREKEKRREKKKKKRKKRRKKKRKRKKEVKRKKEEKKEEKEKRKKRKEKKRERERKGEKRDINAKPTRRSSEIDKKKAVDI